MPQRDPTRCILTFSNQHQTIRNIMEKHWFLLKEDPILTNYVADNQSITFRRAKSLKDNLVRSHFTDTPTDLSKHPVTTPCGNCESCPYLDTRNKVTLPNGEEWTQKYSASCWSTGVIYLLQCACGSFYVGKTRRTIATRIKEHITSVSAGYFKTVIGRHAAFHHNYGSLDIKFLPLNVIPCHERGGNWDKLLLQTESRWIFQLRADKPPGLNEQVSFAPFL